MTEPFDSSGLAAARRAMVDCQLRPQAVINRAVIGAMAAVPRERFVPPEQAGLAYADVVVPLGGGRFLSPPIVTGRLLGELAPEPGERALVIGAGTGYSAAVLAAIGLQVVALDDQFTGPEIVGVRFVRGPLAEGWLADAPYDLILIDGAVEQVPDQLAAQLAPGGRIGAVLKRAGVDRLVIGRRSGVGFGFRSIVDADAGDLPGFERPRAFTF